MRWLISVVRWWHGLVAWSWMVPRATEALAEAMVATSRIEAFLNLAEDSASRSRLTDQIKSAIWIELWEILGCN